MIRDELIEDRNRDYERRVPSAVIVSEKLELFERLASWVSMERAFAKQEGERPEYGWTYDELADTLEYTDEEGAKEILEEWFEEGIVGIMGQRDGKRLYVLSVDDRVIALEQMISYFTLDVARNDWDYHERKQLEEE